MLIKWIARVLGIIELKTEIVQVRDRMDELEKKIDQMKISEEEKDQLKEALAARRRILRFNDELLLKIKHSKEMFDDILKTSQITMKVLPNASRFCKSKGGFC